MAKEGKIRAVLKDWDDTAVRTYGICSEFILSYAQRSGRRIPAIEEVRGVWGEPLHKMFGKLWEGGDPENTVREYLQGVPKDFYSPLFPGTLRAVKELARMGFVLGVISSSPKRAIARTLEQHKELSPEMFSFIHGAEDTDPFHKPDPRVFNSAFERLKEHGVYHPGEVLYVGDGKNDLNAARGRGLGFVAVLTGTTTREEFLGFGVREENIIPSIKDLPEKVLQINCR